MSGLLIEQCFCGIYYIIPTEAATQKKAKIYIQFAICLPERKHINSSLHSQNEVHQSIYKKKSACNNIESSSMCTVNQEQNKVQEETKTLQDICET
jgi:hypothetical protein